MFAEWGQLQCDMHQRDTRGLHLQSIHSDRLNLITTISHCILIFYLYLYNPSIRSSCASFL